MHVLPRVRELHERFAEVLSVLGVHAGKFSTERHTERIAEACDRLGVAHPVVNDRQFRTWRDYDVNAWPTVALIDPEGYLALVASGEFAPESMAAAIERIVDEASRRGTLARGPDPRPAVVPRHEGTLRFPTRAIVVRDRLWVADTGHGRVLECAWNSAANAATVVSEHSGFKEPRGLAELGGSVYVADRAGQAVWRLEEAAPVRVAGTGRLGDSVVRPGPGASTDIRSPWGLVPLNGRLAVTMAGSHQMWVLDPSTGELSLVAGTGLEALDDGGPERAALAQPTGAAMRADDTLVFADCETSAVRVLEPHAVRTLVGTGLFDFGDRPGIGAAARLQHCEDVAVFGDALVVADTYNDRLKRVDATARECVPWNGEAGESGALREPAGVWSDGSVIVVCDTGHHRVVVTSHDGTLTEVELA